MSGGMNAWSEGEGEGKEKKRLMHDGADEARDTTI